MFESEDYGRYEIKSGPLKGKWAANAFKGKTLIVRGDGETRREAIDHVKEQLDRLEETELSSRDLEGAPSANVYQAAFVAIGELPEGYRAMLSAHLHAPDHMISATQLAEAACYANWSAANLHYGLLAAKIANEINFVPPSRTDGTKIWTCAIARAPGSEPEFPDTSLEEALMRKMESGHFEWQMRSQVVQALISLGY